MEALKHETQKLERMQQEASAEKQKAISVDLANVMGDNSYSFDDRKHHNDSAQHKRNGPMCSPSKSPRSIEHQDSTYTIGSSASPLKTKMLK